MTPPVLDRDVVGRRLRLIRTTLDDLSLLADRTQQDLVAHPVERAAAERFIQVLVDLAIDVNGHILIALRGAAPETGRASFLAMAADVGALEPDLAARLALSAGMRNLLVHRYGDIDVALVALGITEVFDLYERYVRAVADWLERESTG